MARRATQAVPAAGVIRSSSRRRRPRGARLVELPAPASSPFPITANQKVMFVRPATVRPDLPPPRGAVRGDRCAVRPPPHQPTPPRRQIGPCLRTSCAVGRDAPGTGHPESLEAYRPDRFPRRVSSPPPPSCTARWKRPTEPMGSPLGAQSRPTAENTGAGSPWPVAMSCNGPQPRVAVLPSRPSCFCSSGAMKRRKKSPVKVC